MERHGRSLRRSLADYAREKGASVLVRGLRAVSDFERISNGSDEQASDSQLKPFFLCPRKYFYTSSQLITGSPYGERRHLPSQRLGRPSRVKPGKDFRVETKMRKERHLSKEEKIHLGVVFLIIFRYGWFFGIFPLFPDMLDHYLDREIEKGF